MSEKHCNKGRIWVFSVAGQILKLNRDLTFYQALPAFDCLHVVCYHVRVSSWDFFLFVSFCSVRPPFLPSLKILFLIALNDSILI